MVFFIAGKDTRIVVIENKKFAQFADFWILRKA